MTSVYHDLNRKLVMIFFGDDDEFVLRMSPDEALRVAKGLEQAARAIEDAEYDTAKPGERR